MEGFVFTAKPNAMNTLNKPTDKLRVVCIGLKQIRGVLITNSGDIDMLGFTAHTVLL